MLFTALRRSLIILLRILFMQLHIGFIIYLIIQERSLSFIYLSDLEINTLTCFIVFLRLYVYDRYINFIQDYFSCKISYEKICKTLYNIYERNVFLQIPFLKL